MRSRWLAVAVASLGLVGGGVLAGCGDEDNEGAAEEAGKLIDEGAKEAGQAAEKGAKELDKEVDADIDVDSGDDGKGKKKKGGGGY
jgi:hypothetical protein